jgi:hypothetical protein
MTPREAINEAFSVLRDGAVQPIKGLITREVRGLALQFVDPSADPTSTVKWVQKRLAEMPAEDFASSSDEATSTWAGYAQAFHERDARDRAAAAHGHSAAMLCRKALEK